MKYFIFLVLIFCSISESNAANGVGIDDSIVVVPSTGNTAEYIYGNATWNESSQLNLKNSSVPVAIPKPSSPKMLNQAVMLTAEYINGYFFYDNNPGVIVNIYQISGGGLQFTIETGDDIFNNRFEP